MTDKEILKNDRNVFRILRWVLLGAVLVSSTVLGLAHQFPLFGWTPPGVDALCPFGGLEAAWKLLSSGGFLQRVAASSVVLLVGTIVLLVVGRRAFCGQFCPLGTLQELVGNLGKKVLKKKWEMPQWLDKGARYLKYGVLVGILILTWVMADLILRPFDPWVAYHHLSSAELLTDFAIGFGILLLSLAGSFFYERFFCKYLCPMGAALAPLARFSPLKLERTVATCIDCKLCDKACPMNIIVSESTRVKSAECIDCGLCVAACPVKDTLNYQAPGNKNVKLWVVPALAASVMTLVVLVGTLAGQFNWTILKHEELQEVAKVEAQELGVIPATYDPSLIRGRDSFQVIADSSGLPKQGFLDKFKISELEYVKPIKDSTVKYGFTVDAVRVYVAESLGLPPPILEGH